MDNKEKIEGCASGCAGCSGCGHDHAENFLPEGMSPIITLTDDEGKDVKFEFTSGGTFPEDLQKYKMIIHCGACTLSEREMKYRISCAAEQNIPITNYGIAIAYMNGILKRSVKPFDEIYSLL